MKIILMPNFNSTSYVLHDEDAELDDDEDGSGAGAEAEEHVELHVLNDIVVGELHEVVSRQGCDRMGSDGSQEEAMSKGEGRRA